MKDHYLSQNFNIGLRKSSKIAYEQKKGIFHYHMFPQKSLLCHFFKRTYDNPQAKSRMVEIITLQFPFLFSQSQKSPF